MLMGCDTEVAALQLTAVIGATYGTEAAPAEPWLWTHLSWG